MNASRRNREINGTPGASAHSPDVGTALINLDFNAALQQAMHEDPSGLALDTAEGDALYRVPYHPSEDGNTVELGVEQAAFSQNAADFQTSLGFINMQLKGLAKVIAGQ